MDPHAGVWIDSPLRIEPDVLVATIRSLLPHIVRLGIATEEEVDIDNLADRIREGMSPYFLVVPAVFVGAWAQKP